ncbi:hypothetical protein R1flu_015214 [Riccia fluitans]|uniref:Beta-glucosidase n=1 Tax=Riccia fluitans TaxID=41844 RepID=A0ABD1YIA2_9MARC
MAVQNALCKSSILVSESSRCIHQADFSSSQEMLERRRFDFPKNFVFGTATSSFQVEGASREGGRGLTIWDHFTMTPGKILDNSTAEVAADQYHRYKEDIELMKELNMDAYRFSIAWSRIIPDGSRRTVNMEGIAYYNRLIDALIEKGITPYVTLYHWDLPLTLHESLGGWTNREIVKHFAYYAEVCFASFGDRVKHWITFNEPAVFCLLGYGKGVHAPGRTSDRTKSAHGNSSTEPYMAGHNVLISHATVVEIYRSKYKSKQAGTVGFTIDCEWAEPLSDSIEDKEATERRRTFQLGWWLDPIFFGDYPALMRRSAGDRLPHFTEDEKLLLRDSLDFIGLNHYTTRWVTSQPAPSDPANSDFWWDQGALTTVEKDGVLIGEKANSCWLYIVPWGIQRLIEYVWETYKVPIYICENGMDDCNNLDLPLGHFLNDSRRVNYYRDYLKYVHRAIENGADVRAYFAWSLLDNFEWAEGYTSRFGLYYVDFTTQKRYAKDSAKWFSKFLEPKVADPCQ